MSSAPAQAGPLHDPFVEMFQVGTWPRADDIPLEDGWPDGLLVTALPDSAWLASARAALAAEASAPASAALLAGLGTDAPEAWRAQATRAVADLASGMASGMAGGPGPWRAERLTLAFGRALAAGDTATALAHARTLLVEAEANHLLPRERIIWRLRAAALDGTDPVATFWPEFSDLGPWDTGNSWALWSALRAARGHPRLPAGVATEDLGGVLARIGSGRITAADLESADLPAAWKAGLGGILLPRDELAEHFSRHASPPRNFRLQGYWVRGKRRQYPGHSGAYENLAARADLSPGWRMDLLRRASERRVLANAWLEGLDDLDRALALAGQGSGSSGLRKRTRQWAAQCLVLALAHGHRSTAQRIDRMARGKLTGDERAAYLAETSHFAPHLSGAAAADPGSDLVDLERFEVRSGATGPVVLATPRQKADLVAVADAGTWDLWWQWGLALADTSAVAGDKRRRAVAYRNALLDGADSPDPAAAVLGIAALRFADREWLPRLQRKAFDTDVGRSCGLVTPPDPSLVPDLLPAVRGSELDRHALLGFCLALGDMRGVIGLAYELPGRGLTRAEKRRFLYPLPAAGAIRDALLDAQSDPALLLAIARNESLFEPAVRSRAGALGWMQIMPFHYPEKGARPGAGNWRIPAVSIARGDALVEEARRRYNADPYRVLAAYNAGPTATDRWDRQLGGGAAPDLYMAWIGYPETRAYVEKVLIDREIYSAILGAGYGSSARYPDTE